MTEKTQKISLDPRLGEPLTEQLHRQITWQIACGQLKPGDKLASVRDQAERLTINMHTVRAAYLLLEADGLVRTRAGSGTRVLTPDPVHMLQVASKTRTYTIGVILPALANPFYHTFLDGVQEVISREQLLLFVCDTRESPEHCLRYFAQLAARNVDGILIASYDIRDMIRQEPARTLPIVTVDQPGCKGPVVNLDLENAGYQATRHLLEHGHRRIGLVMFKEGIANVIPRISGYSRALREAGVAMDESLVARMIDFSTSSGEMGTRQLLALGEPPTAIITIADTLALGALKALKKAGKRVPEDMALASVDDIAVAELIMPALTTVALPSRRLGLEAMQMLQNLMNGKKLPVEQITLPTKLIIRQSCGCR
jgi:LacI family transcriptional regulator